MDGFEGISSQTPRNCANPQTRRSFSRIQPKQIPAVHKAVSGIYFYPSIDDVYFIKASRQEIRSYHAVLRAFKAIRPTKDKAAAVAALPYDVLSTKEAREIVKQNPISFLRIDKAEVDLPEGTDLYADEVYLKAKENLESYINDGIFIQDEKPCLYIYRQIMDGRAQTGIVGCLSIDDYVNNVIKKHELTRADKEVDRFRHVDT